MSIHQSFYNLGHKSLLKKLKDRERLTLQTQRESVRSSYENIITWRNEFAHEGVIPATPTYEEVKKAYTFGKKSSTV